MAWQGAEFVGTDRFEILRRLGAGGMGVVYEAFDAMRGEPVALKTLHCYDPQALYRLKREFRVLADMRHPNLVRLGELLEANGTWFFTMELVRGTDFLSYVGGLGAVAMSESPTPITVDANGAKRLITTPARPRVRPLPSDVVGEEQAAVVMACDEGRLRSALQQLAIGLAALHSADKVHRDIKPQNILATPEGRVVLLDFGLVADTREGHHSTDLHAVGTVAYMAPEQAAARPVTPAADWYSVGVVLYEALTGCLPIDGRGLELLLEKQRCEPLPPRMRVPHVPADLDALCSDLLRIDPAARPAETEIMARLGIGETSRAAAPSSVAVPAQERTDLLVGREQEVEFLRTAFADAESDWVTAEVIGESGIGKSALMRHFATLLATENESTIALPGRCRERESVPYKAFDGAIDCLSHRLRCMPDAVAATFLPRRAALLSRVFPVLSRVGAIAQAPMPRDAPKDPHELRLLAFAALRELLARLADRHRVVLLIDDWQWADVDSRQLLRELSRPPDAPRLLIVLSAREAVTELVGEARRIVLRGLDTAAATRLTRALLERTGASTGDPAAAIVAETAGHPLYIQELVRRIALDDAEAAPSRLDDAIWRRVRELPEAARKVLEVASVAGTALPRETVAHAAGLSEPEVSRHQAVLREANLLRSADAMAGDSVEPYHDRVREAILGHLDPASRVRHHLQIALALERGLLSNALPELVLHHFEAAGDRERAGAYALQAADGAAQILAFDRAAELYGAALALAELTTQQRRAVLAARGQALLNAGRGASAAEDFLAAAEGADPEARLEYQRSAAAQFLFTGHLDKGLAVLAALAAEVGLALPPTPRRALLSLFWCRARLRWRGVRWQAGASRPVGREELTRLEVLRAVGQSLTIVDTVRAAAFAARHLLASLEIGDTAHIGTAIGSVAVHLGAQGGQHLVRARKLGSQLRSLATQSENPYLLAWEVSVDGVLTHFEGKFREASAKLAEAEFRLRTSTLGTTWELNTVRIFRGFALRYRGSLVELAQLANGWLQDAQLRGDRYLETMLRVRSIPLCELACGRSADARAVLGQVTWVAPTDMFHAQHWYALEAGIEIALYEGTAAKEFPTLIRQFEGMSRSLLSRVEHVRTMERWARAKLLLAATVAGGESDGMEVASRLARRLQREAAGYAVAIGQLISAAIADQEHRDDVAVTLLHDALTRFDRFEMDAAAAATRRRLGQLLGGSEGQTLVDCGDAMLRAEGVVDVERLTEVYAPGFRHR